MSTMNVFHFAAHCLVFLLDNYNLTIVILVTLGDTPTLLDWLNEFRVSLLLLMVSL